MWVGRIGRYPLRWHHALLALWTVVWFMVAERHAAVSWHYLRTGQQLLFHQIPGGGLALYANHPELQIGPVSFLVAGLFAPFHAALGEKLADAFMSGLGLYMLVLVGRAAADHYRGTGLNHRRLQQRVLIAGAAFIPMWVEVSVRFAHLDDVLALFFTTLAVRALVRGNATAVGVFLALAVDSKPWAVGFLPLLLALPRPARLRSAAWAVGLVAVAWLPFYLTHLDTLAAAHFTIPNQPASSLRWFGVQDAATPGGTAPPRWPSASPWARWPSTGAGGRRSCCWPPTPVSSWTRACTRTTTPRSSSAPCSGTRSASAAWSPGSAGSP